MPHSNDWRVSFRQNFWQLYTGYPQGTFATRIEEYIEQLLLSQKQELAEKVIGLQKDRHGSGDTHHWWVKYDEVIALLQEPSSDTGL